MKATTLRDVAMAYQAFAQKATSFFLDADRRLAQEDDLSEATIRSFEVDLTRLLKAGSRLERAIRHVPDSSPVLQELRDRTLREQAQSRALMAFLRTLKASGAASTKIPVEALR